jgi:hypothetical protein
LKKV